VNTQLRPIVILLLHTAGVVIPTHCALYGRRTQQPSLASRAKASCDVSVMQPLYCAFPQYSLSFRDENSGFGVFSGFLNDHNRAASDNLFG